jgi:predicted NAD/FAD-binding protein
MTIQGQAHGRRRPDRPQVAVISAGVAGLTAAYLLQRAFDVTLYEAHDRLGGHAHTHDIPVGDSRLLALDSGFLVHNTRTYPNLIRLFSEPRLRELRRGETIPWCVIAAQIAPRTPQFALTR